MNLPHKFTQTILSTFGKTGKAWLDSLPSLIEKAKQLWGLENIQIAFHLSYNFIAFAHRGLQPVVLKIGIPNQALINEITALQLFNSSGAILLLEANEKDGILLLERAEPGQTLCSIQDDEKATHIAIDVMLKLWKPVTSNTTLPRLSEWFTAFELLRKRYDGITGPLDKNLVEQARGIVKDFFQEAQTPMLIHGDLHHFNILSSGRGWIAIDPKGIIGPAAYELGPLLINPHNLSPENLAHFANKRIAIITERLGFEKERILKWAIAHAVLSACWALEDNTRWDDAMHCAKSFSEMLTS